MAVPPSALFLYYEIIFLYYKNNVLSTKYFNDNLNPKPTWRFMTVIFFAL